MDEGLWLDGLVDWLDRFPWQWFVTLTFRPGFTPAQARWRLLRWAEELRDSLGTGDFQWVGVPENGTTGLNFHYHVLVAGLDAEVGAAERLEWMRRWYKLAGDAQIEDFKPDSGGVRYVLKHVGPRDFDAIQFHLASRAGAVPGEMKNEKDQGQQEHLSKGAKV